MTESDKRLREILHEFDNPDVLFALGDKYDSLRKRAIKLAREHVKQQDDELKRQEHICPLLQTG